MNNGGKRSTMNAKIIIFTIIVTLFATFANATENYAQEIEIPITVKCTNSEVRINTTAHTPVDVVNRTEPFQTTANLKVLGIFINVTEAKLPVNIATNESIEQICGRIQQFVVGEVNQKLEQKIIPEVNKTIEYENTKARCQARNPDDKNVEKLDEQITTYEREINGAGGYTEQLESKKTTIIALTILTVFLGLLAMGLLLFIVFKMGGFNIKNDNY